MLFVPNKFQEKKGTMFMPVIRNRKITFNQDNLLHLKNGKKKCEMLGYISLMAPKNMIK
jgi:hypothetical protein